LYVNRFLLQLQVEVHKSTEVTRTENVSQTCHLKLKYLRILHIQSPFFPHRLTCCAEKLCCLLTLFRYLGANFQLQSDMIMIMMMMMMMMQLVVITCFCMSLERWREIKTGLDQDGNSSTSPIDYESRYANCNIANFGLL
jgi:hypothetical protein